MQILVMTCAVQGWSCDAACSFALNAAAPHKSGCIYISRMSIICVMPQRHASLLLQPVSAPYACRAPASVPCEPETFIVRVYPDSKHGQLQTPAAPQPCSQHGEAQQHTGQG